MKFRTIPLLFVLLFAFVAHARENATLQGTLTDPSGAAIAAAEITAESLPSGGNVLRATSNVDGRYSLALSPGSYRVRVTHASFARLEQEMTLTAGEARTWSPRMELEQLAATVVVTAQAEPALADSISSPVTVLTRQEITERQALWLAPLLASTPGFAVSRLGREGGLTTLFLNGGNSNFTKVLVDGAPLNEPGGLIDFSNFTLDNVEKIEVVRGAESALYGSDAMSGVVQILSRRGTTRRPIVELLAEGGKYSTARGSVHLSGLLNHFDYSATAARFESDGQGPNDRFRNTTLSGNFGWRFDETNSLRLTLRSNTSDAGVPGQTLFTPPNLDQHNGLRHFTSSLGWGFATGPRWRHRLAAHETYIRQLFDNPASDFCFSTPPFICDFAFTAKNQFHRAGLSAQSSYLVPRGGVTFGYSFEVENGFLNSLHAQRRNHAGYLEGRYLFGARLSVTAGARAEANASFGTRVVPRAGLAYTLRFGPTAAFWGATRLRFSYGLGIKEPRLDQSFAPDLCFPGNPDLRPERSRSFNVGAEQVLAQDRARVSVDYFDNRFRDIVSFTFCFAGGPCPVAPPPGCPFGFGTFFNTDLARARGANVALEARPARWLRLGGNYTFTASRVLESPNAFDLSLAPGNRLFRRPVHSGSLVLNAAFRRMNWNLAGTFVGRRTDSDFLGLGLTSNSGYGRVDLAGSYDLRRGVVAFARVENLFDKQYQETLGYPALRRSYRAGMRCTFGGE